MHQSLNQVKTFFRQTGRVKYNIKNKIFSSAWVASVTRYKQEFILHAERRDNHNVDVN